MAATSSDRGGVVDRLPAAVVFDFDGTLVDTESMSDVVLAEVLADLGHEVDHADLLASRGRAFSWLQEWLWERWAVSAQEYRTRARPVWERQLEAGVPTFDDTMALLDDLEALGVPMAVCTSSGRSHLDRILARLELADRFAVTVSASDVVRHKPDPMPYAMAVDLLGTPPARTVAVEDTVVGATSAVAAGLRVIGRPHPDMADLAGIVHLQVEHVDLPAVRAVVESS